MQTWSRVLKRFSNRNSRRPSNGRLQLLCRSRPLVSKSSAVGVAVSYRLTVLLNRVLVLVDRVSIMLCRQLIEHGGQSVLRAALVQVRSTGRMGRLSRNRSQS